MNTIEILLFICVVAAVCGLSPTIFSIFTSLLAGTLGKGHSNARIWYNSLSFFVGFISTIVILGTASWYLLSSLNIQIAQYLCLLVAVLAVIAAIIDIKDFFWYGRGISHRPHKKLSQALHTRTTQKFGFFSSFCLGVITLAATSSNIGLLTISAASLFYIGNFAPNIQWLLFYGTCLIIGLFVCLLAATNGLKISILVKWQQEHKSIMRLGNGLGLMAIAWLILLLLSRTIMVGL